MIVVVYKIEFGLRKFKYFKVYAYKNFKFINIVVKD